MLTSYSTKSKQELLPSAASAPKNISAKQQAESLAEVISLLELKMSEHESSLNKLKFIKGIFVDPKGRDPIAIFNAYLNESAASHSLKFAQSSIANDHEKHLDSYIIHAESLLKQLQVLLSSIKYGLENDTVLVPYMHFRPVFESSKKVFTDTLKQYEQSDELLKNTVKEALNKASGFEFYSSILELLENALSDDENQQKKQMHIYLYEDKEGITRVVYDCDIYRELRGIAANPEVIHKVRYVDNKKYRYEKDGISQSQLTLQVILDKLESLKGKVIIKKGLISEIFITQAKEYLSLTDQVSNNPEDIQIKIILSVIRASQMHDGLNIFDKLYKETEFILVNPDRTKNVDFDKLSTTAHEKLIECLESNQLEIELLENPPPLKSPKTTDASKSTDSDVATTDSNTLEKHVKVVKDREGSRNNVALARATALANANLSKYISEEKIATDISPIDVNMLARNKRHYKDLFNKNTLTVDRTDVQAIMHTLRGYIKDGKGSHVTLHLRSKSDDELRCIGATSFHGGKCQKDSLRMLRDSLYNHFTDDAIALLRQWLPHDSYEPARREEVVQSARSTLRPAA